MFSRALLAYRNTPDQDTGRSPAQVLFRQQMRDFIPVHAEYQPRQEWFFTQDDGERTLRRRHLIKGEELTQKTHALTPLTVGTVVSIQNQRGFHGKRWNNSGVVMESLGNSQYKVKVDGPYHPSKPCVPAPDQPLHQQCSDKVPR